MRTYLLDSDVIIAYLRGYEEPVRFTNSLLEDGASLGCCPVNVVEIYSGMKEKERGITEELINSLRLFPIDLETAKLTGDIIRSYRSAGTTTALADAMVAAVAIQNNLILATYNEKHYPMADIAVVSPAGIRR